MQTSIVFSESCTKLSNIVKHRLHVCLKRSPVSNVVKNVFKTLNFPRLLDIVIFHFEVLLHSHTLGDKPRQLQGIMTTVIDI